MIFEGQNSFFAYCISTVSAKGNDQIHLDKGQVLRPVLNSLWWWWWWWLW